MKPRFSIRTLLILMVVVATVFTYLGIKRAERRQLISDIIEALGGELKLEDGRVTAVTFPYAKIEGFEGRRLKAFKRLTQIKLLDYRIESGEWQISSGDMIYTQITDDLLERMGRKPVSVMFLTKALHRLDSEGP